MIKNIFNSMGHGSKVLVCFCFFIFFSAILPPAGEKVNLLLVLGSLALATVVFFLNKKNTSNN